MRKPLLATLCILLAFTSGVAAASGKDVRGRPIETSLVDAASSEVRPMDVEWSLFQAAAVDTTVLGWWQFDAPDGSCDPQGWVAKDLTDLPVFHVDGPGCNGISAVAGAQSMWCGQWATTAEPWCNWAALPGYGNDWNQILMSDTVVCASLTWSWKTVWETEAGYDFAYAEYWNSSSASWVALPVDGGAGYYEGSGGPLAESFLVTPPGGWTVLRYRFKSDGAYSDEDGIAPTTEGALKVDDVTVARQGGPTHFHNFESEACGATGTLDGFWEAIDVPGFGIYAKLVPGATLPQIIDICNQVRSCVWAFFDDPSTTNYACGGWPDQGAVPYGPDENGLYLHNEIWSPWIPITGTGPKFYLEYKDYEGSFNALVFPFWYVRTRDNDAGGCPTAWENYDIFYPINNVDYWQRNVYDVSSFVPAGADEIQISLACIDMCPYWCGVTGTGQCHSFAPLLDQVKITRVAAFGPEWTVRDIDMWQDNFPEDGTTAGFARCDMAQDILSSTKKNILPGDSLKVVATDPSGLAADNTGGRAGKAVYVFVKVTDRFGTDRGYTALQVQSPDSKAWGADPNNGLLRYPYVAAVSPGGGWYAYRMDSARTSTGSLQKDTYCADLMDLAAGPDGPPYHPNEAWAQNTGIFVPGDVVWYFFGAKNTSSQWSYISRAMKGQGRWFRTNNIANHMADACEWSVLPDAGRLAGDLGDILYVDDADDRGGPAQAYFDFAFRHYGLEGRVDRFDVLGPSSVVGNSLAGRVKSVPNQIVGATSEIYQKVLWNSSDLSRGLMGDGGTPNGGTSAEKSDDFGLAHMFLNIHTNNPGWACWGDDVVQDWNTLTGAGAVNVKTAFMNHTLTGGDQRTVTGVMTPQVLPVSPLPGAPWLNPAESFFAYGGCPVINDFDIPGQAGLSRVAHKYNDASIGPNASLSQSVTNGVGSTARFFLAGFGFDVVRDDDAVGPPDYAAHLREILRFFQNEIGDPIGIDPVALENRLENNYPNPFNPTTTIGYSIVEAGRVSLRIYNVAGQLVRTLVDEEQAPQAGGFTVRWDARNNAGAGVASGVYFYRLTAKEFSQTKRMVLVR